MSYSSPSRRRLLAWAAGAVLSSRSASSGILESLPGFQRKDPRIQTFAYREADSIDLAGRAIAIRHFGASQAGKPAVPDFAPHLGRALTWVYPDCTVHLDDECCVDVLIEGEIELFHRIGAQGLRTRISAVVYDISDSRQYVLWMGTKDAGWVRRFPTANCLLTLADHFVASWAGRQS